MVFCLDFIRYFRIDGFSLLIVGNVGVDNFYLSFFLGIVVGGRERERFSIKNIFIVFLVLDYLLTDYFR